MVDWAGFRLWADAQTGVILRQQTLDEYGRATQDTHLQEIAYDLPISPSVLALENLEQSRFEPSPNREILPEIPVLDPDSRLSSDLHYPRATQTEPPGDLRSPLDGCR